MNKRVTVAPGISAPTSLPAKVGAAGRLWLMVAVVGGIAVFWTGLISLGEAWSTAEYSHGPLIPVLSLYLFLHHLERVPPSADPARLRWPGVLVMAGALLIAAAGNLTRIPDIVTYGLIIWVYGLILVAFGWRRGRQFWPSVLHLFFMLPLPAMVYWKMTIGLQLFSSSVGVALIRMMDIPVFLDGNIIDLGVYKLQVAEACSGLRYLFPVMSFSYVFAVLYRGPVWHKAVLLLSAAPITILMNSFRIGMIGVLVDRYGISQAEGFLHFFEGWVIFLASVLILFGLARLLQRLSGDRRPFHEALDLDFSGLGEQFRRVFDLRSSGALIMGAGATLALGVAWHATPERAAGEVPRDPMVLFPREIAGWTAGPLQRLEPEIAAVLGADDYFGTAYSAGSQEKPIDLFIAYYEKQTEGDGIHSPEVCIPTGGWEMSRVTAVNVPVTLADGTTQSIPVNRAVIQKGLHRQLVYYWFEGRGRRVTSAYVAKAMTMVDAVARGRTDGALVRLITPIGGGEPVALAEQRLQDFLGELVPVLPRFIPE